MDNKPQIIDMLARQKVQQFIVDHENDDESKLLLKYREVDGVPAARVVDQILSRRKAKHKLPTWYGTGGVIYPPPLHIAQSSSETTAAFKVSIVKEHASSTFSFCDLTTGFGVDTLFIARLFREVDVVEKDDMLRHIARHNFQLLDMPHITWHGGRAEDFIRNRGTYDLIYIDPSRRDANKKRVFMLTDCEPDVTALQTDLLKKTDLLMVKTSPLLDLQQGLASLSNVKAIYIVSVDNECKEVLFLAEKNFHQPPVIICVNLQPAGGFGISSSSLERFEFTLDEERTAEAPFSKPLTYLYEPNTSVMKGGAFKLITSRFNASKLQSNTHLYTNDNIVSNFPGRIFSVIEFVKLDSKLASQFPNGQANVISRNFPLSVDEIRKKTKLREGGDLYLICASGESEKWSMMCKRLK